MRRTSADMLKLLDGVADIGHNRPADWPTPKEVSQ